MQLQRNITWINIRHWNYFDTEWWRNENIEERGSVFLQLKENSFSIYFIQKCRCIYGVSPQTSSIVDSKTRDAKWFDNFRFEQTLCDRSFRRRELGESSNLCQSREFTSRWLSIRHFDQQVNKKSRSFYSDKMNSFVKNVNKSSWIRIESTWKHR